MPWLSGSSAEEAAREVRKRLVAIARSESYIDWRKRKSLVNDLQVQPGHPSLLTIAECRGDVDAYGSQFHRRRSAVAR